MALFYLNLKKLMVVECTVAVVHVWASKHREKRNNMWTKKKAICLLWYSMSCHRSKKPQPGSFRADVLFFISIAVFTVLNAIPVWKSLSWAPGGVYSIKKACLWKSMDSLLDIYESVTICDSDQSETSIEGKMQQKKKYQMCNDWKDTVWRTRTQNTKIE